MDNDEVAASVANLFECSGVKDAQQQQQPPRLSETSKAVARRVIGALNDRGDGQPVGDADTIGVLGEVLCSVARGLGASSEQINWTLPNAASIGKALCAAHGGRPEMTVATLAGIMALVWLDLVRSEADRRKENGGE